MTSFVSDVIEVGSLGLIDDPLGIEAQEDAAREAAQLQTQAGREAISALRQDLAPFVGVGSEAAGQLMGNLLQPSGVTAESVLSDPFFQALSEQQARDTLAQRAALGLAGSGGTQDILQRNLLQLGEGFRQQREASNLQQQQARFNQLFNIAGLGQSSAAQTGTQTAGLLTDIGTAQSIAAFAPAQHQAQLTSGLLGLGGALGGAALGAPTTAFGGGTSVLGSFSDSRLKQNVTKVGADEFGGIYEFEYKGGSTRFRGRMAQELKSIRPDSVFTHSSGYLCVSEEFAPEVV